MVKALLPSAGLGCVCEAPTSERKAREGLDGTSIRWEEKKRAREIRVGREKGEFSLLCYYSLFWWRI